MRITIGIAAFFDILVNAMTFAWWGLFLRLVTVFGT